MVGKLLGSGADSSSAPFQKTSRLDFVVSEFGYTADRKSIANCPNTKDLHNDLRVTLWREFRKNRCIGHICKKLYIWKS